MDRHRRPCGATPSYAPRPRQFVPVCPRCPTCHQPPPPDRPPCTPSARDAPLPADVPRLCGGHFAVRDQDPEPTTIHGDDRAGLGIGVVRSVFGTRSAAATSRAVERFVFVAS